MNHFFPSHRRTRRLQTLLIGLPLLATSLLAGGAVQAVASEVSAPPTSNALTISDGAFLPLKNFAVRVDNVAPNAAADQLEVLCTFKNQTEATQTLFGQLIESVATDADGIGMMGRDFYSPTGEPSLIWEKKPIAPGATLQVRILIGMPPGTAALQTLTLWEDTSLPQTIDISKVVWPGAKPAANPAAMGLSNATAEFKPCGATLDVRFDGFRKARSGWYEAFFTFKNTADSTLHSDVLDYNSSALDLFTVGQSGKTQRYDELMRANGEKALSIPLHYAILPGTEARVRYTFSSKDKVPSPIKVTVSDRVSATTLEWPVSAR